MHERSVAHRSSHDAHVRRVERPGPAPSCLAGTATSGSSALSLRARIARPSVIALTGAIAAPRQTGGGQRTDSGLTTARVGAVVSQVARLTATCVGDARVSGPALVGQLDRPLWPPVLGRVFPDASVDRLP